MKVIPEGALKVRFCKQTVNVGTTPYLLLMVKLKFGLINAWCELKSSENENAQDLNAIYQAHFNPYYLKYTLYRFKGKVPQEMA